MSIERNERIQRLHDLREGGMEPYPPTSLRSHTTEEALAEQHEVPVCVAGRIMAIRNFGKLSFCTIQDGHGIIQVVLEASNVPEENYKTFKSGVDIGDIIEVHGVRGVTKRGEESVMGREWRMLGKSLRPLPAKYHGLSNKEARFRKRYLDLIANREVFELFKTRSKVITTVRNFLNTEGFLEVETPVLQTLYGGTNARPFETHINAYDMDMYLRIAPELYLKRLLVAGYEKLYELGKNFRNEGVDQTHNPEFTMIEWYEAYTDYHGMMDRAEALYKRIAMELFGKLELPVGDAVVSLADKWPRVRMVDAIKNHTGYNVEEMPEAELLRVCNERGINVRGAETRGQMIMELFERLVTPKLINPVWIIDYPKEVSPLARAHREDPRFVERFECYIMGKEIGDGWSEITDPLAQRERFEKEQRDMQAGREEAHPMDEDFLEALEYAMPPMGGIGIGIDRLVMLFTNKWSIREILFFPTMKPEKENKG